MNLHPRVKSPAKREEISCQSGGRHGQGHCTSWLRSPDSCQDCFEDERLAAPASGINEHLQRGSPPHVVHDHVKDVSLLGCHLGDPVTALDWLKTCLTKTKMQSVGKQQKEENLARATVA